jgi:hypothetical protein
MYEMLTWQVPFHDLTEDEVRSLQLCSTGHLMACQVGSEL